MGRRRKIFPNCSQSVLFARDGKKLVENDSETSTKFDVKGTRKSESVREIFFYNLS